MLVALALAAASVCVEPPPRAAEPKDPDLVGAFALAMLGKKATREEARKLGEKLLAEEKAQPKDLFVACTHSITDVIVANKSQRVDACLDLARDCPKACLDEIRAYCKSN